jgi:D-xylulose reductase
LDFAARYAATGDVHVFKDLRSGECYSFGEEHNLGAGADVAIDASGAEVSVQTAIHVLRPGGTYVQGGMGGNEITFPIAAMCVKELNVRGSFRYGCGDYDLAIEFDYERKSIGQGAYHGQGGL